MAFWDTFRGVFSKKAPAAPADGYYSGLVYPYRGQPPRRGTRELLAAYRQQPWLRAVTGKIASTVAHTNWRIYTQKAAGQRAQKHTGLIYGKSYEQRLSVRKDLKAQNALTEITDHPLLDLLNAANPVMTGLAAIKLSQIYLDLKGESFWLLQRNADGMPTAYFPLPPHWIMDVPNAVARTYRINAYTTAANSYIEVPETEVLWLKDLDPENPYGRGSGSAEALGDELETDENAAKFLSNWFRNNALPAAMVSFEGANEAQLKAAKERWESQYQGSINYGRTHFASGKMNVARLDSSFREQQLVELRKAQRDMVSQTFGVPPEVMGVLENSNRATIDSSYYLFSQSVITPRLEFLRTELQAKLVPLFDDRICLEYDSPVPEDAVANLAVFQAMPGAFSLNEWRELADEEPIEGWDEKFPPMAQPGQSPASAADGAADPEDQADSQSGDKGDASGAEDPKAKIFRAFRRG